MPIFEFNSQCHAWISLITICLPQESMTRFLLVSMIRIPENRWVTFTMVKLIWVKRVCRI